MSTILVVIILSLSTQGTPTKTTIEMQTKSRVLCEIAQIKIINSELPKGNKLLSVTCETTEEA